MSLVQACIEGDLAAVEAALAADPEAHAQRDEHLGSTPLIFAAHRGFFRIVAALLDAGADVEARERASATTALHWTADGGHAEVAALLIAAGAELEPVDGWYLGTPLTWTAVSRCTPADPAGRRAVAATLAEAGAEPDLFAAVLAEAPLSGFDLGRRLGLAGRGRTALHLAAAEGRSLDALLEAGAPREATDAFGAVPAALSDDPRLVVDHPSVALAAGERPASDDPRLLHFAAAEGHRPGAIRCDMEHRVEALVSELRSEVTPLWRAVRGDQVAVARTLLAAGADPGFADPTAGVSALHAAVMAGSAAAVRLLLEAGADPGVEDGQHGATPAAWAGFLELPELVELLS